MISFFERKHYISWGITLLIAAFIFYMSSLTFGPSSGEGLPWQSLAYHGLVFFGFTFFLQIALVKGKSKELIFLGIILAFTYALTDEIHQFFVPGRATSVFDMLVNTTGIVTASMIYALSIRFRK